MIRRKEVLTTGEVAQICKVAPRTVTKWFDTGQLKGYRIPGSRDRRIPTAELVRFMKTHNIPTSMLELGKMRILIIDGCLATATSLAKALEEKVNYEVQIAASAFEAGAAAERFSPHVLLINILADRIDISQICENVRLNPNFTGTKIIALTNKPIPIETETATLIKKGFDAVIAGTTDIGNIIKTIEHTSAMIY